MTRCFLILLLVAPLGCAHHTIRATGSVVLVPVEGGFWAIVGDDGVTYDPVGGLSPEFQQKGMRVKFTAEPKPDAMTAHMTGTIVQILKIERLQ